MINTLNKSYNNKPLISIITVVLNGEKFLDQTIQSIINQTYKNIEYIIIDGGSTDGTLEIIKKYEDKISYWVSEEDNGIGNAFNKGVKISKGTYINFQGHGDGFISYDALEKVFQNVDPEKDMLVSARIKRIGIHGIEIFTSKYIEKVNKWSLLVRMSLPHQGLFTHKNYFKTYGLFDENNTFCMDYEHLLRSYKNFPRVHTSRVVVANWRADGLGNGKITEIYKEWDKIKRDNKVANNLVLNLVNYWNLLKHYVKKFIGSY
tara:strand:+ start:1838 stop:2623 length:786 start_codon:yes stop_codon:yes gene_type:complete